MIHSKLEKYMLLMVSLAIWYGVEFEIHINLNSLVFMLYKSLKKMWISKHSDSVSEFQNT